VGLDLQQVIYELGSGQAVFEQRTRLCRYDALVMGCDGEVVALGLGVRVPSFDGVLWVRLPLGMENELLFWKVARGETLYFILPYVRTYLDYPEDTRSGFVAREQHQLYARAVARVGEE
jgi:hypothetical protein